ncbi:hypothetical protein EV677_2737 [Herminiimonas fonticola]|uniref:Uncharacterized protein n=1 Tax=Herminiimonas fonticola TaxID=303380 RepID=A0A4R6G353_9BURK|nr:hypothetical protein EV677_2737 [Herminiimonas fonticola]
MRVFRSISANENTLLARVRKNKKEDTQAAWNGGHIIMAHEEKTLRVDSLKSG